ncbi:UNVERIFIED_CONTAM: hypothetical protein RKD43_000311 [Streptomyces graminofaciens]
MRGAVAHGGLALAELVEDVLGGGAVDPVDPVVQQDDPLRVVGEGLVGVVHDQRRVHPPVDLQAEVRMEPVRAWVRGPEAVGERAARPDGRLRHLGHAVHLVAQGDAVPVHRGGFRQMVGERQLERVAGGDPHLLARQFTVVRRGPDGASAADPHGGRGGREAETTDLAFGAGGPCGPELLAVRDAGASGTGVRRLTSGAARPVRAAARTGSGQRGSRRGDPGAEHGAPGRRGRTGLILAVHGPPSVGSAGSRPGRGGRRPGRGQTRHEPAWSMMSETSGICVATAEVSAAKVGPAARG